MLINYNYLKKMRHKGQINKVRNKKKSYFPKDLARYLDLMTQNHFIHNTVQESLWSRVGSSVDISTGTMLINNQRQLKKKNRKNLSNHQNFGTIMIIVQQINRCKKCLNATKRN